MLLSVWSNPLKQDGGETMARPLEFEYVIECEDPKAERERLLSRRASAKAVKILKEADALYDKRYGSSHGPECRARSAQ